jgi:flagellar biosynthesis/type III secretory pathway chaperone
VEKILIELFQLLQVLFGQHRQLLEIVRAEREHLVQVDHHAIQKVIGRKQNAIEEIGKTESQRIKLVNQLSQVWGKPLAELTLPKIIIELQGLDPKMSEQFRSTFNALTVLIQRISEQNRDNQKLLNRSIENIAELKGNILGSSPARAGTYSQQGHRVAGHSARHLISREA